MPKCEYVRAKQDIPLSTEKQKMGKNENELEKRIIMQTDMKEVTLTSFLISSA